MLFALYISCFYDFTMEANTILYNNSNSMFLSFFSAILIGPLVKLNIFYTSIKTYAYEYLISALIYNELYIKLRTQVTSKVP